MEGFVMIVENFSETTKCIIEGESLADFSAQILNKTVNFEYY
jgi:hypothetical protein